MKIPIAVRSVLKPSYLSMVAVLLSLGAWLFPTFGVLRKQYGDPERINLTSASILLAWYLVIFVSLSFGQKIGAAAAWNWRFDRSLARIDSSVAYLSFTVLAAVGLAAECAKLFRSFSIPELVLFVAEGQANQLSVTFQEDYSAGLISLRYAVIYSASLALYRIIDRRRCSMVDFGNIVIFAIIVLNSRVIFVATLVVLLTICNFEKKCIQLRFRKLAIGGGVLFLLLGAMNASRNASYYNSQHLSFGAAGLSQILAYLGAPFQASVASAKFTDELVAGGVDTYRNYTDVDIALNTNSAFIGLHQQMGYACWLYIAAVCTLMGFLFGVMASQGKTLFLLPCGAIMYGSAELWRLDAYQTGIFKTFVILGIGLPALMVVIQSLRRLPHAASGFAQPRDGTT